MKRRPVVLTFVGYYLPGYKSGGPIQSVANMVEQLGEQFDFRIVTRDRDSGDVAPYPGVLPGEWQPVGKSQVRYMPVTDQTLSAVARLMRETPHDLTYLNSFFDWHSTTLPLLAQKLRLASRKPVILAPRGEFSQGALALKAGKKSAFLAVSRGVGLYRGVLWQASSEHEERDIRRHFSRNARVHIASDLPRKVPLRIAHEPRAPAANLRVLFLSRISPMKNLSFLLDVLAKVSVPVDCSIIGFIDAPEYWKACERQIAALPRHVRVRYEGAIPAPEVPHAMARHDLLFLPTLGENFGHVVIEALAAGTPVLISNRTPWRDIEAHGAGWVLPLDNAEPFAAVIERLYHERPTESLARREAALAYAHRFTQSEVLLGANRALFDAAFPGSAR